jgi:hypothetical protein
VRDSDAGGGGHEAKAEEHVTRKQAFTFTGTPPASAGNHASGPNNTLR